MRQYRWVTDAPIEDVTTPQRWEQLRQSCRLGLGAPAQPAPAAAGANGGNARNDAARALLDQMVFRPDCRNLAYLFMGAAVGLMQVDVFADRRADHLKNEAPDKLFWAVKDTPVTILEFVTVASGTGAGDALMECAVNIAASTAWSDPQVALMAHGGAVPRYQAFGFVNLRGSLQDGMVMILKPRQSPVWVEVGGAWRIAARVGVQYPVSQGDPGFR